MSKVAVQVIRRFFTCQHKNIKRTFLLEEGTYHEVRPSCAEPGCNGYEMMRVSGCNDHQTETIMLEGNRAAYRLYWDEVERREEPEATPDWLK